MMEAVFLIKVILLLSILVSRNIDNDKKVENLNFVI